MISVQSHSKQIKLLNDYIAALQKQIASSRKESEEHIKQSTHSAEEIKKMNEQINRLRNENGQLRFNIVRQEDIIRKAAGLQKQLTFTRDQLQKAIFDNNRFITSLQQAQEANKVWEEKVKIIEGELKQKTQIFVGESFKDRQNIQELKRIILDKQKQKNEISQILEQQRKNFSNRVLALEQNNAQVKRTKQQNIDKLTNQLESMKLKYSKDMNLQMEIKSNQNEQMKQLVNSINQSKSEIISLKRQILQNNQSLTDKNQEINSLSLSIKAKNNQYDALSKKSNEQKILLLKGIQKLEEEKKRLQALNNSCKGDISQNIKALNESLKRSQDLSLKLFSASQQIQQLNEQVTIDQDQIAKLTTDSASLAKQLLKKQEQLNIREQYIRRLKAQLQQAFSQIQQLEQMKSGHIRNLDELRKLSSQLRSDLQEANSSIGKLIEQKNERQMFILRKLGELKDGDLMIRQYQDEISRNKNQIKIKNEMIEKLNRDIITYKQNLEEKVDLLAYNQSELKKLRERIRQQEQANLNLSKQIQQLGGEVGRIAQEKVGQKQVAQRELGSRDKKIEQLIKKYEKLQQLYNIQTKNNQQAIKRLQSDRENNNIIINQYNIQLSNYKNKLQHLQSNYHQLKATYQALSQQYNLFRKKKQNQCQQLAHHLRESEKKNEKKNIKIEQLNQEINNLQNSYSSQRKNLGDSQKQQLQRQKSRFNRTLLEIKAQYQEKLANKQTQLQQARISLDKSSLELETRARAWKEEWSSKQKSLNQSIKKLQIQKDNLENQIKKLNFTSISQSKSKSTKQMEVQILKKSIEKLQIYSKQQKNTIEQLNKLLDTKTRQIQSLESSNALLRKQVISALSSEQTSRKQLIQTKSKVSMMITSNSKSSLHDFPPPPLLGNIRSQITGQKKSSIYSKDEIQPRNFSKGRPAQKNDSNKMKVSLVQNLNDSNFGQKYQ